jgi:L-lysine exporter family protein LysE/ArgO
LIGRLFTVHFLQEFMLGLAYVAPIGMQNLYVINTATRTNGTMNYSAT